MSSYPDADAFRRLAQSSHWLWQSVEFVWRGDAMPARRARIDRPGHLVVWSMTGAEIHRYEADRPHPGVWTSAGGGPKRRMRGVWPSETTPIFHADGLVERLPDIGPVSVDWDQPFFENYHWVAMLDPRELSDAVWSSPEPDDPRGVEIDDVRAITHHGRPAWQAVARPTPSYEPRCSCCGLLIGDLDDQDWEPDTSAVVRLDVATGICVHVDHQDHSRGTELDVEIVAST